MPLSKSERERIEGKFIHLTKFRHSIRRLAECPQFENARQRLLEEGYLNWQIFDAATQAIMNYRLDPPNVFEFQLGPGETLEHWSTKLFAYVETFYEVGDEPMPLCGVWGAGRLERQIITIGLTWLNRQGLAGSPPNDEQIREMLTKAHYFEKVSAPVPLPYPGIPVEGP